MKDYWRKYGSPYDPNFSGKFDPRFQEQQRREEERPQLRGCGDPNCNLCNPHTAGRGMSSNIPGSFRPVPMPNDILREMEWINASARPTPTPRPKSEARKAVEPYLISVDRESFSDIIGNEEALAGLRDAIEAPKKYAKLYKAYGMKMPRGALLSGPPGCGKTMFARAAASEMLRLYGMKEFISISGSSIQSPFVGVTEGIIKEMFTYAREYAGANGHPLLIFIDEAEVLLPDRTGRVRRVASWEESQVAVFLSEMDGMQESGAFVLLATNRPEVIDQAVLRDGRCDFKVVVKRPTQAAIEVIIRNTLKKCLLADDIESLVFAATESFYDPHKVIFDLHQLTEQFKEWFEGRGFTTDEVGKKRLRLLGSRNFGLEHIISGAMAVSIGRRATMFAFARDKESGKAKGIIQEDVIRAVNGIFEENKKLEHQFAILEFLDQINQDMEAIK